MIETTIPGLILMFLLVFCMYMAIMNFVIFKLLDNNPDSKKTRKLYTISTKKIADMWKRRKEQKVL
jgi:hypothetical protein